MGPGPARRELPLYVAEGLTSFAATWLNTGIYLVTTRVLGFTPGESLALAASQGVMTIVGSLLASRLSGRLGGRRALIPIYAVLALLTAAMSLVHGWAFVAVLLAWMFVVSLNWPSMEAILCHAPDAAEVSRRVGRYNVVWSATGALAIATLGAAIGLRPGGQAVFLGAALLHAVSAVLVAVGREQACPADAHLEAPPELLAKQAFARRLSRTALPASYVVINSLIPLLALRLASSGLSEAMVSLVVSVWLVARIGIFAIMGATSFWHAKPGILLLAVGTMIVGFGGAIWPGGGIAWLVAMQVLIGAAVGAIYFASLYFGLVLAHGGEGDGGATEQNGLHEATIGLGTILGPGAGAAASGLGISPAAGVSAVVVASAVLCVAACFRRSGQK